MCGKGHLFSHTKTMKIRRKEGEHASYLGLSVEQRPFFSGAMRGVTGIQTDKRSRTNEISVFSDYPTLSLITLS